MIVKDDNFLGINLIFETAKEWQDEEQRVAASSFIYEARALTYLNHTYYTSQSRSPIPAHECVPLVTQ
jgi:hypothetical protein